MARKRKRSAASGFGGVLAQAMLRPQHPHIPPGAGPGVGHPHIPPGAGPGMGAGAPGAPIGPGAPGAPTPGYDPMTDPAVAAAIGLAEKARADAQARATAKRIQAAIEYGDAEGLGLDDATVKAAKENPYSVVKQMERDYQQGTQRLDEDLNSANLYYSGERAKALSEAALAYGQNRYNAASNFRGVLSGVDTDVADALMGADRDVSSALLNSDRGRYGPSSPAAASTVQPGPGVVTKSQASSVAPRYRPTSISQAIAATRGRRKPGRSQAGRYGGAFRGM